MSSFPTVWPQDIANMHQKFSVNTVVNNIDAEKLLEYLQFRIDMIQEEVNEAKAAVENKDADGVVDAIIDNIVFSIGTLDAFGVNPYLAWNRVHYANMQKSPGVKDGRPNKYGFPDLMKPSGWQAPNHTDNVGLIQKAFDAHPNNPTGVKNE